MRVLIDYRPALRDRSGVGEYTHQLVKALLASNPRSSPSPGTNGALDLTIFSSSWKDRLTPLPELRGARVVDRRVPVRLLNFSWHRLGWPPAEQLTGLAFDVAHSPHPLLLPVRNAAQVIMVHDLHFLAHPERTRAEIRRDYPDLVKEHAHRAGRIIVPSQFTAREVERQLGIDATRIAVCPPGAPEWAPRETPAPDGYILFFGTLEPRKNIGGLLDAYERLLAQGITCPELVLAGRASDEAGPWLDRITRPPLAGHVRHVGSIEPANRQALYAGARLLVMPSFEEGFGIPVLEAMTFGVPVVAASSGALPEVLGDAGPLVNPDRPEEIASAMRRLLEDDAYAAVCTAKGVLRARQFNWHRTARLVYEAYEQAISEHQSGVHVRSR